MLIIRHWVVRRAGAFARLYRAIERLVVALAPVWRWLGRQRMEAVFTAVERPLKGLLFDCRMCGQCMVAQNGMACPMVCPKSLRNGPCGGVRADGSCEVDPAMACVWVEGWSGLRAMRRAGRDLPVLPFQPPLDHRRAGRSAWLRGALAAGENPDMRHLPSCPASSDRLGPSGPLEAALRRGDFVVTAELSPPDSADPGEIARRAVYFDGLVDAINVPDGSGANCHMSSLASAKILLDLGCAPVMQFTCRDRNRIALQGDILGAAALGVVNLLCLSGDAVSAGDQPEAKPVFDLDSLSLLAAARGMRDEGRFLSGRPLACPPRLFLGAASNPFAPPAGARLVRLERKIEAGAQFIQTQFCFDLAALRRFMAAVCARGLERRAFILVGVGPLVSARSARWMRAHVPGVSIPDALIERLEKAGDPRAEGREICIEMIREIRHIEGVAGVHLMIHKHERLVSQIIARAGVLEGRREAPRRLGLAAANV
jgi:5,10-methylenetetrahydrofolate reductase